MFQVYGYLTRENNPHPRENFLLERCIAWCDCHRVRWRSQLFTVFEREIMGSSIKTSSYRDPTLYREKRGFLLRKKKEGGKVHYPETSRNEGSRKGLETLG